MSTSNRGDRRGMPVLAAFLTIVASFAPSAGEVRAQEPVTFLIQSPTMRTGEMMPRDYTPDGRNLSPPLTWTGLPEGTREIAVLCQDHGVGSPPPWVHWIIYNIPGTADGLPEGVPVDPDEPMPREIRGAVQGNNGWGLPVYRGPAPPVGNVHHYDFAVYALDEELDLPPGLDREELLEAIEGHVIGRGNMVPIYERQPMNASEEEDELDFQ
ncbi:MAG: YbhB/YbcL family Raf kinase inhibitor-like protein [Gemmatimonadota bacterium]